jgi:hypothetical protein
MNDYTRASPDGFGSGKTTAGSEVEPIHSYLLIRKDMPLEAQMAQCAHAAQEAAFLVGSAPREPIHIVILECTDERELLLAAERLERKGLSPELFYEPHWPKGHSSLYLMPQRRSARLKAAMGAYKLWRVDKFNEPQIQA